MKIYNNLSSFERETKSVLTTGTFDGVHLGHKKILERLVENARQMGVSSVLFTFYPHPRMVLYPEDHGLSLLTSKEEKRKLLEEIGLDILIEHPFSEEFSQLTPREYVRKFLVKKLGTKKIIVGYDHRFGKNRMGDYNKLVELGEIYNFEVEQISAFEMSEIKVSSTKIRTALSEGDLKTAEKYLGRKYTLAGNVVNGDKIGTTLGFPTANIEPESEFKLIPKNGVYAINCTLDQKIIPGLLNIGTRPTVNKGSELRIEAHLLNWDGSIYNEHIELEFLSRIRDERKFDNLDQLKEQIQKDKDFALNQFK